MAKSMRELIIEDVERIIKERHSRALSQDIERMLNMRFKDLLRGEVLERS
jgi:hypothetical protein